MLTIILGILFALLVIFFMIYLGLKIYMLGNAHAIINNALDQGLTKKQIAELSVDLNKKINNKVIIKKDDNDKNGKNPLF